MKILSLANRFLGLEHYLHARGYGIMASLQCRVANMENPSLGNLQNPVCQFHQGPIRKSSGMKSVHLGHQNIIFGPEYSTSACTVRAGRTYAADSRNDTNLFHENGFSQTYWASLRNSNFSSVSNQTPETKMPETKPSLWKRFKDMYKEYWYILVPVHILTSCVWFGSFYYTAVSGFDVTALLEHWGVSEKIIEHLKSSGAGNIAVAYALYKLATPARYTVTLGGTTITINYLKNWGFIKPAPSASKLNQMIKDKGTKIQNNFKRKTG